MVRHLRAMARVSTLVLAAMCPVAGVVYVAHNHPVATTESVTVQTPSVPLDATAPTGKRSPVPPSQLSGVAAGLLVAVRPGGALEVVPGSIVAVLGGRDRRPETSVGPIRVIDPRGTLEGWSLRVRVTEEVDREGRLQVRPGQPVVVDGDSAGLVQGRPGVVSDDRWSTLMSARAGHGGGTYQVSFTIRAWEGEPGSVRLVFAAS